MKFITALAFMLVLFVTTASSEVRDNDGILGAKWNAPTTGNPVAHYVLKYTVNGVESGIVETSSLRDSSIILTNVGDWAVYDIYAVSVLGDTSITVPSDTVIYDLGTGIGPPTGVTWE